MEADEDITRAVEKIKNRYLLVNVVAERVKALKKKSTFSDVASEGELIRKALQEISEEKIRVKNSSGDPDDPSSGGGEDQKSRAA